MPHTKLLLTLLCTFLCLAAPARAQLLIGDPRFDEDDRDCIVMTLGLDDEQAEQYDELAVLYTAEITQLFTEMEERVIEEGYDGSDIERNIEIWEDFSDRVNERQRVLFQDLGLFMSQEQIERIPDCRMRLRRISVTNGDVASRLPGGIALGIDPITLATEMDLPDGLDEEHRAAFDRALEQYDRAMKSSIQTLEENVLKLMETFAEIENFENNSMAGLFQNMEQINKVIDKGKALRATHQDLTYAIGRTLPEKLRERWDDRFTRAIYPGPYRRTNAEILLDRLQDQTALTDEEFGAVFDILAGYERRASSLRKAWCDELDDFFRDLELSIATITRFDPDSVGEPFRAKMRELDDRAIEKVRERIKNPIAEELIQQILNPQELAPEIQRERGSGIEIEVRTGN